MIPNIDTYDPLEAKCAEQTIELDFRFQDFEFTARYTEINGVFGNNGIDRLVDGYFAQYEDDAPDRSQVGDFVLTAPSDGSTLTIDKDQQGMDDALRHHLVGVRLVEWREIKALTREEIKAGIYQTADGRQAVVAAVEMPRDAVLRLGYIINKDETIFQTGWSKYGICYSDAGEDNIVGRWPEAHWIAAE